MKSRWLAMLVPVAAIVACTNNSKTYLKNYQVLVDPSFNSDQVNSIIQAAEAWETAVPITFEVSISECTDPGFAQICVRQSLSSATSYVDGAVRDVDGLCFMGGDHATIYMFPTANNSDDPSFFGLAFLHELGHAQGLMHHEGCFVMNPVETECAKSPTQDDIDQWWSIPRQ